MRFINPKTDFAFKKIFGSEESRQILISFLNAILYKGDDVIQDVEILDPYVGPRVRGMKSTYLDLRVRLNDRTTVIIEMQVLNYESFEKRILYNAAKTYSTQLQVGDKYNLLNPIIALTITDFRMFDWSEEVIARFVLKEKDYLMDYPINDIELVFVELPKFTKPLEELETLADKWIFFLKSATDLNVVPDSMNSLPEFQQAFALANEAILTPDELHDLQQQEFYLDDMKTGIERTAAKAAAKAVAKIEAQVQVMEAQAQAAEAQAKAAEAQAKAAEAQAQAATDRLQQVVINLLNQGMTIAQVSQITGLSTAELEQFRLDQQAQT